MITVTLKNIILLSIILVLISSCQAKFSRDKMLDPAESKMNNELLQSFLSSKDENLALVTFQMLLAYQQNGWKNLEIEDAKNIADGHSDDLAITKLLFHYYLEQKAFELSRQMADRAEDLGANSAVFYKNKASLFAAMGENERAIDYINKALLLNASDFTNYKTKGEIYLAMMDTSTAIHFYEKSYAQDPKQIEVLKDLVALQAGMNRYQDAKVSLVNALEIDSTSTEVLKLKAEVYYASGDVVGGLGAYRQLLVQYHELDAGLKLAAHFEQLGRQDSIIHYADRVLLLDTINISALLYKATAFDQKGYYTSALMNYQEILNSDSTHEEALAGLKKVNGKIAYLRKLKEQREAIPTFDFASPTKKKKIN